MRSTFNLFLISISLIVLTLLTATFWDLLKLGDNKTPLALSTTIAFGISVAGIILGISEIRKRRSPKAIIGLIGHVVVLAFFFYTAILALNL